MSMEESWPLSLNDEVGIILDTIASAAIDAYARGVDFQDLFDDPEYKERIRGIISPDIRAAMLQTDRERNLKLQAETEANVQAYIEAGLDEDAARRKVGAEALERFVRNRIREQDGAIE